MCRKQGRPYILKIMTLIYLHLIWKISRYYQSKIDIINITSSSPLLYSKQKKKNTIY